MSCSPQKTLDLAVSCVNRLVRAALTSDRQIRHKGPIDLVTDLDFQVEQAIVALLRQRHPDHLILAEETHNDSLEIRNSQRPFWVLDPIDGTTNLAHRLPVFCLSLALVHPPQEIICGLVHAPLLRETYRARLNQGATLNGKPISASRTDSLQEALLATGFAYDVHQSERDNLDLFSHFLKRCRGIRRMGSAALDLCWVACGRFDGYWEEKLKPWDLAAGVLIAREAGASVSAPGGLPFDLFSGAALAAAPSLHPTLVREILPFLP